MKEEEKQNDEGRRRRRGVTKEGWKAREEVAGVAVRRAAGRARATSGRCEREIDGCQVVGK